MYYGYRCYNKNNEPLGWLYTPTATEITWTEKNFNWCKRWKKQQTAEKYFNNYDSRWRFQSHGGYLQIELMPEFEELPHTKLEIVNDGSIDNTKIKTFKFEFVVGLPESHGIYLFILADGSIKEGYFSSFSIPNHNKDVRVANYETEDFDYCNVIGWLNPVKETEYQ